LIKAKIYFKQVLDKEISSKQNIIKEVFNTSSNAAITAKWINKEVLTLYISRKRIFMDTLFGR
jgi:predicted nucleic-acid-binding protein